MLAHDPQLEFTEDVQALEADLNGMMEVDD